MSITSLSAPDILKITSGQVIIDLRAVIKELVENSIDAHSTNIDITFHNYGLDSISITDNGHGIDEPHFDKICLRGYTSKIAEFHDLEHLQSLGFRGEALNSICLVSSTVKVTTATVQDYPSITEIEFDHEGQARTRTKRKGGMAGNGTMVVVQGIFSQLPVRLKILVANAKREFHKAINLLINYLIAYPEIRFIISNVTHKRNVVLNSRGGNAASVLDNMNTIFGANGSRGLNPIDLQTANNYGSVVGYISSSSYGYGRSSQNRQFLFINKRPVILKKLQRIINDVFKQFNHLQYPVFVLNIVIDPEHLDVNIVPDKTSVAIHNEPDFLEQVRVLLMDYYSEQENLVPKNCFNSTSIQLPIQSELASNSLRSFSRVKEVADNDHIMEASQKEESGEPTQEGTRESTQEEEIADPTQEEEIADPTQEEGIAEPTQKDQLVLSIDEDPIETSQDSQPINDPIETSQESQSIQNPIEASQDCEPIEDLVEASPRNPSTSNDHQSSLSDYAKSPPQSSLQDAGHCDCSHDNASPSNYPTNSDNQVLQSTMSKVLPSRDSPPPPSDPPCLINNFSLASGDNYGKNFFPAGEIPHELDGESINITVGNHTSDIKLTKRMKSSIMVHDQSQKISIDHWRSRFYQKSKSAMSSKSFKSESKSASSFGNVDDLKASERQEEMLTCTIKKQDFLKLRIIGQFNLGFILVSFNDHDMFIIDQHASDEKINFEQLNRQFQIDFQRLVLPQQIELSSIDELLVINHAPVFHRNGFLFEIDHEKPCGKRISLTSLPVLKNTPFSIHDFHELVDKVDQSGPATTTNSNQHELKCSKIRSILASRACRSSIMIGQHLQWPTMKRILNDLSSLDKPWNCPHGRPTMRHLMSINQRGFSDFDRQV